MWLEQKISKKCDENRIFVKKMMGTEDLKKTSAAAAAKNVLVTDD